MAHYCPACQQPHNAMPQCQYTSEIVLCGTRDFALKAVPQALMHARPCGDGGAVLPEVGRWSKFARVQLYPLPRRTGSECASAVSGASYRPPLDRSQPYARRDGAAYRQADVAYACGQHSMQAHVARARSRKRTCVGASLIHAKYWTTAMQHAWHHCGCESIRSLPVTTI